MQVPAPPVPVSIDGARRVVYELHLTNFAGEALTPLRVEVRDASDGKEIAAFDGDALAKRLAEPGGADRDGATIAPRRTDKRVIGKEWVRTCRDRGVANRQQKTK